MDKWEMTGSILGLLARGIEAAADAIKAGTAEKEDEAFGVLFGVLAQVNEKVLPFRVQLDHDRHEALKALEAKFPAPQPTVLVDPDKADETTKP